MIKLLINYDNTIYYICFIISKLTSKKINHLNDKKMILIIKIAGLKNKLFTKKAIITLILGINSRDIYILMTFIIYSIKVIFEIILRLYKIWYSKIVLFSLIFAEQIF